jgi:hypothetical protein
MSITMGFELEVRNKPNTRGSFPSGMEVGYDGSVPHGDEYRTIGGHSPSVIREKSEALFAHLINPIIDQKCSFHIHVSSRYFRELRLSEKQFMGELAKTWLLFNLEEAPTKVKQRLRNIDARECFFAPLEAVSDEGYGFIAIKGVERWWRTAQGTMEFRGFGNISKQRDALKCFELAEMAFKQAEYKVKQLKRQGLL